MTEYTKASKWPVLDSGGAHVGDIVRQPGTTLWSLQRRGMDRPFKRNIRSLEQAQRLAVAHPQVWGGPDFDLRRALIRTGLWCAILAALFGVFLLRSNPLGWSAALTHAHTLPLVVAG